MFLLSVTSGILARHKWVSKQNLHDVVKGVCNNVLSTARRSSVMTLDMVRMAEVDY